MKDDYLKYWRVIRYFVKAKYKLTQCDLDMLLFLHSEKYFDKGRFKEYEELMIWERGRFGRLTKEGWIKVFRKRSGPTKAVFTLTYKSSRLITSIYKKLSGEEIPTTQSANPMYAKNVKYSDKVYRNFIKSMHASTKLLRHPAPE